MFISFDVSKVVQSPECDHGHDEESRNGRDIKIYILEAYIWISETFQVKSGFYLSTEGLPAPPGGGAGYWAYMGHEGEEEGRPGQAAPPLPPRPNRTRKGGGVPISSFPFPLSFSNKARGGSPTPGGSRTPPGAPLGPAAPPLSLLYIQGQGGTP